MYEKPDYYAIKAKKEGYAARSVYKLIEIQEKYNLIQKEHKILDLGCAPGSWTQYTSKIIGEKGLIVGIDIKSIKVNPKNAILLTGDFLSSEINNQLSSYSPFDGIISDMAPDTTGDKMSDCYISSELVMEAFKFTSTCLKKNGFFIAKIFQGGDEKEIMAEMKQVFLETKWFKPKSSRSNSYEIFLIGINFNGYKN